MKPFVSTKNENGSVQAGSHLIIVDDSACLGTTIAKSSNPKILNYYRQFLVKGFGDRFFFEFRIYGRFKTGGSNWRVAGRPTALDTEHFRSFSFYRSHNLSEKSHSLWFSNEQDFVIKFEADESFDFDDELKIEFYKAVSSYMGSKIFERHLIHIQVRSHLNCLPS